MTFNVSSLSPAACGAYVDALATPAVSRLLGTTSSFAYSDNQLACLIAGAVALALLLGVYCCGYARHCFHHFDYFSTDFWIDAGDADAEDEDGADHLQPFEYGGGVTSKKSLRAVPRLKKLGGVAVWAGIALGAALCGDLLSWVSADEGVVQTGASHVSHPFAFAGATASSTLTLRTVLLHPQRTADCILLKQLDITGALYPKPDAGWTVHGTLRTVRTTSATINGTLPSTLVADATVSLSGCEYSISAALLPAWPLGAAPRSSALDAPRSSLTNAAVGTDALKAAAASALASLGVDAVAPPNALITVTLPAGQALVSWALVVADGSSSVNAYSALGVGEASEVSCARGSGATDGSVGGGSPWGVPLPPLSPAPLGSDSSVSSGALTTSFGRASTAHVSLTASRREDRTTVGARTVGMGWRAAVRGSATVTVPVPLASAVTTSASGAGMVAADTAVDSFTLALGSSDTALSTIVSTRFSPLAALGMLTGLFIFGVLSARLVHDVAEAACGARSMTKMHGNAMWVGCLGCLGCSSHSAAGRLVLTRPPTDIYAAGEQAQHAIAASLSSRNIFRSQRGFTADGNGARNGDMFGEDGNVDGAAEFSGDGSAAGLGADTSADGGDMLGVGAAAQADRRAAIRQKLQNRVKLVGLFSRLGAGAEAKRAAVTAAAPAAPELGPINPLLQLYRASKRRLTGGAPSGAERPRFGGFEGGYVPGAITSHSWLSRRAAEQQSREGPTSAGTRQKMPLSFLPKDIAQSDKEIASKGFRFSVVRSALQSRGGAGVASSSSKIEEELAGIDAAPNMSGDHD